MKLSKDLWNERYENQDTGWDIGHISTPLKEYFEQLENKNIKILIPGCGNAYEAAYLYELGFKQVHLIDWAQKALDNFQKRNPKFPKSQLICGDFFKHQGQYELIIEQTFFCAIHPELRADYVRQVKNLLTHKGKLVGLLFNEKLYSNRPPFGGTKSTYMPLFSKHFKHVSMQKAYNSIPKRKGRELFIKIQNSTHKS